MNIRIMNIFPARFMYVKEDALKEFTSLLLRMLYPLHRANAFAKLGVHSPAELTRLAFESGYADAKTTLS